MKKIYLAFFCVIASASIFAQTKQKVAVYVTGGQDNGINEFIGAYLVDAIVNGSNYLAVERTADFMKELNKEQEYQRTGAVNDDQISQLGQQFGVQLVCVAKVGKVGPKQFVSARLIDVETATVKSSTKPVMFTMDDVDKSCAAVAVSLISGESAEQRRPTITENNNKTEQINHQVPQQQSFQTINNSYGTLVAIKTDVYSKGVYLNKDQTRMLFANTAALDMYNSGKRCNAWGKGLVISGYIFGGLGLFQFLFIDIDGGVSQLGFATGLLVGGYSLKSVAKKKIAKSVNSYNGQHTTSYLELNYGFTRNGVGLVLKW